MELKMKKISAGPHVTTVSYRETGFFSKIVEDYLSGAETLRPFYQHPVTLEGIKAAIRARQKFFNQRELLYTELIRQYSGLKISEKLVQNIRLLTREDTFTVTTAHQPNIFTGPVFFVYKILHTIRLAEDLGRELPEYNFVPVYYMGSEDADLGEIGTIFVRGEKYQWNTPQTGAVGRMQIDTAFTDLMDKMEGQLGVDFYGREIMAIFRKAYRPGITLQQATLELVNELFGRFGLVVLIPDNAALKAEFKPIVKKELTAFFSHHCVEKTIEKLGKNYKVQTSGRELNLFYLVDDLRNRIAEKDGSYQVHGTDLRFTQLEILAELDNHPERFSGNVILRGVFQETVLPNIAFIGGGGELAYWLELKNVFETAGVPYPVLILRNSFLLLEKKQENKIQELGFETKDFFLDELTLLQQLVKRSSAQELLLDKQREQITAFYQHLSTTASAVDATLARHVEAIRSQALKKIIGLEKKMVRAERKKFEAENRQIQKLKHQLFPGNNLQERVENLAGFYANHGETLLDTLLSVSPALELLFVILTLDA